MNKIKEFIEKIKGNKFLMVVTIGTIGIVGFLFLKKILSGGSSTGSTTSSGTGLIYSPTAGGGSSTSGVSSNSANVSDSFSSGVSDLASLFETNQKINAIVTEQAKNLIATGKNAENQTSSYNPMTQIYNIQGRIMNLKQQYAQATTEEDKTRIHNEADSLRRSAVGIATNEGLSVGTVDTGQGYAEAKIEGIQL